VDNIYFKPSYVGVVVINIIIVNFIGNFHNSGRSRSESSVNQNFDNRIVSDYGLDDRAIGVRSPAKAKDFSSNPCVQTGSGAHPASCPMDTGGPIPGG
jgi:hypothetical protein